MYIITHECITATLHFFGQLPYHTPIHGVYGRDIKDLFAESYPQVNKSLFALLLTVFYT